MPESTVTVVALIRSKSGYENQLKEALSGLVAPTLQERGCINYDLHQDIEDPTLFIFHENWVTHEDLNRHLESDHLRNFVATAGDYLAAPPDIRQLVKIS